jgi:hypothetical protein
MTLRIYNFDYECPHITFHLKIEETKGDVLYEFLGNIFGVEFGAKFELEWRLLLHILAQHLHQNYLDYLIYKKKNPG